MDFRGKLIPVCVLATVLAVAWAVFGVDWDSRAVKKRFDSLAELVEKDGPVSSIEALGRGRKLVQYFSEGAFVEYYPGRELPRNMDAMGVAFVSVWQRIDEASITVVRHKVDLADSKESAESLLSARCSVILDGSERMGDTLRYRIYWIKRDGDWLIERMVVDGTP